MDQLIAYAVFGLFSGAAYAIAASGLVLTYTTTRVFNIAHGAFGMVFAFVFWELSVGRGMPAWLALVLVVFVIAPLVGVLVQRFVARDLGDSPVSVSLVVTVGLFVFCIGIAQQRWPENAISTVPRVVPPFFAGKYVTIGSTQMTYHQVITVLASVLVAIGLYALLNRTRIGTAMRASVDNPDLLKLFGGNPQQVAALSWAIGMSLAALAGILLVSAVGLEYYQLTLLVINAYAAAMVGRLKSLPMTFAGAMALGLISSYYVGYVHGNGLLSDLRTVIPAIFLFVAVIALPQAQLRIGQVKGIVAAPVPTMKRSLAVGAAFLVFVYLVVNGVSDADQLLVGTAATYAITMLSLVLLTGYGGFVSLAQLTFVGVGALAYVKLDQPNLYGLLLSTLIAAGVGALVALPVLRLTGLYLALATLAFGSLMDGLIFTDAGRGFGYGGAFAAQRLSVFGHTFASTSGYVMVMAVFFLLVALVLLALRRGVLGRMLVALRDSPAACGTLGLDARWFRVGLFAASAGIAGLAGALYAGLRGTVGAADFQTLNNLPLLLLAVVFGATSVTGAALGGTGLMLLPVLQAKTILGGQVPLGGVMFMVIGVGAILLARDPNGLANYGFKLGRRLQALAGARIAPTGPAAGGGPGRFRLPDLAHVVRRRGPGSAASADPAVPGAAGGLVSSSAEPVTREAHGEQGVPTHVPS